MTRNEILSALSNGEGKLRGAVRTENGRQLDSWQLKNKEYLIVTNKFWNYKAEMPHYTEQTVVRVQLLTTID